MGLDVQEASDGENLMRITKQQRALLDRIEAAMMKPYDDSRAARNSTALCQPTHNLYRGQAATWEAAIEIIRQAKRGSV